MKKFLYLLMYVILLCSAGSCTFKKIGKNLGEGVTQGVATKTDTLGVSLTAAVKKALNDSAIRRSLINLLDSITDTVSGKLKNAVGSVRDSIINKQTRQWADSIIESLTGRNTNSNLTKLQASLVGKSKDDLLEIRNSFSSMVAEILSDTTRSKIAELRNELLGPKTKLAVAAIVDTAVTLIVDSSVARLGRGLQANINPVFKEDISFVKKNATELLIALGIIAAIIVLIVWRSKQKYLKMVSLLTKQINEIPDQQVYDIVTKKIHGEAITTGLEPGLRKVLSDNGLLGTASWKK